MAKDDDFKLEIGINLSSDEKQIKKLESDLRKLTKEESKRSESVKETTKNLKDQANSYKRLKEINPLASKKEGGGESSPFQTIINHPIAKVVSQVVLPIFAIKKTLDKTFDIIKSRAQKADERLTINANPLSLETAIRGLMQYFGASREESEKVFKDFSGLVESAMAGNKSALDFFDKLNVSLVDKQGQIRDSMKVIQDVLRNVSSLENTQSMLMALGEAGLRIPPIIKMLKNLSEDSLAKVFKSQEPIAKASVFIEDKMAAAKDNVGTLGGNVLGVGRFLGSLGGEIYDAIRGTIAAAGSVAKSIVTPLVEAQGKSVEARANMWGFGKTAQDNNPSFQEVLNKDTEINNRNNISNKNNTINVTSNTNININGGSTTSDDARKIARMVSDATARSVEGVIIQRTRFV